MAHSLWKDPKIKEKVRRLKDLAETETGQGPSSQGQQQSTSAPAVESLAPTVSTPGGQDGAGVGQEWPEETAPVAGSPGRWVALGLLFFSISYYYLLQV